MRETYNTDNFSWYTNLRLSLFCANLCKLVFTGRLVSIHLSCVQLDEKNSRKCNSLENEIIDMNVSNLHGM